MCWKISSNHGFFSGFADPDGLAVGSAWRLCGSAVGEGDGVLSAAFFGGSGVAEGVALGAAVGVGSLRCLRGVAVGAAVGAAVRRGSGGHQCDFFGFAEGLGVGVGVL